MVMYIGVSNYGNIAILKARLRSHHTNSFAHIIIKFKNKKVSLFLKNAALCSSLGGKYYRYIILLPI